MPAVVPDVAASSSRRTWSRRTCRACRRAGILGAACLGARRAGRAGLGAGGWSARGRSGRASSAGGCTITGTAGLTLPRPMAGSHRRIDHGERIVAGSRRTASGRAGRFHRRWNDSAGFSSALAAWFDAAPAGPICRTNRSKFPGFRRRANAPDWNERSGNCRRRPVERTSMWRHGCPGEGWLPTGIVPARHSRGPAIPP